MYIDRIIFNRYQREKSQSNDQPEKCRSLFSNVPFALLSVSFGLQSDDPFIFIDNVNVRYAFRKHRFTLNTRLISCFNDTSYFLKANRKDKINIFRKIIEKLLFETAKYLHVNIIVWFSSGLDFIFQLDYVTTYTYV